MSNIQSLLQYHRQGITPRPVKASAKLRRESQHSCKNSYISSFSLLSIMTIEKYTYLYAIDIPSHLIIIIASEGCFRNKTSKPSFTSADCFADQVNILNAKLDVGKVVRFNGGVHCFRRYDGYLVMD